MLCYKMLAEDDEGRLISPFVPPCFIKVYRKKNGAAIPVKYSFVYTDYCCAVDEYCRLLCSNGISLWGRSVSCLCIGEVNTVRKSLRIPSLLHVTSAAKEYIKNIMEEGKEDKSLRSKCLEAYLSPQVAIADVFKITKIVHNYRDRNRISLDALKRSGIPS